MSNINTMRVVLQQQQNKKRAAIGTLNNGVFNNRSRWFWITAAAASLQHRQLVASAWTHHSASSYVKRRPAPTTSATVTPIGRACAVVPVTTTTISTLQRSPYSTTSRLSMSRRGSSSSSNDSDNKGGFLSTLKSAAKSVLPKKWFQSEEEKRAEMERQRVQDEITGGLSEVLKGAPFPIRAMGKLVAPLLGSAMSSLAQAAREQQTTIEEILRQATNCILQDVAVRQALGNDISVSSTPFSQSSSTSSINGQTTTRVQVAVQVIGSLDSGVATLSATEQGLQSIQLQTNRSGRLINVNVTPSASSPAGGVGRSRFRGSSDDDDNIIEAEIIEKDVKK